MPRGSCFDDPTQRSARCAAGPKTGFVWADLSAERLEMSTLRPGEPNFYFEGEYSRPSYWDDGLPFFSTKDGVLGHDR